MSQQKFGRNYRLTIWPIDGGDPIIITLPFTVNIDCQRSANAAINTLKIDIFNLGEATRRRIFQDRNVLGQYFNNPVGPTGLPTQYFNILLEAGYSQLSRIFYGRMLQASSAREGVNIVTRIEATSGLLDLKGSQVQTTLQAPTTLKDVLLYLVDQFPGLSLGAIGDFPTVFNRPVSLNGNTWDLLKKLSGGNVCIDNGKIFILNNNEVTPGVFVINDASGILQTPRRQDMLLNIVTLMETAVDTIMQQVEVQSAVQPEYNGVYKVLGIAHQGTISAATCGHFRSIFTLQAWGLYGTPNPAPGSGFIVVPYPEA